MCCASKHTVGELFEPNTNPGRIVCLLRGFQKVTPAVTVFGQKPFGSCKQTRKSHAYTHAYTRVHTPIHTHTPISADTPLHIRIHIQYIKGMFRSP